MDEIVQTTKEALYEVRLMLLNELNELNWLALGSKLTDRKLYAAQKQILNVVIDKLADLTIDKVADLTKRKKYLNVI